MRNTKENYDLVKYMSTIVAASIKHIYHQDLTTDNKWLNSMSLQVSNRMFDVCLTVDNDILNIFNQNKSDYLYIYIEEFVQNKLSSFCIFC